MYLGVGNGNLLQYSCLENPMDRGAWWATVHRVTKSRTQLKQLSTRWCIYLHLFAFNLYVSLYLKWISWAFLVVQWWWGEVHLPVQETKVFVPCLGGFCMPRSSWACVPQLLRLCFRAPEPQLLSPQLLRPAHSGASLVPSGTGLHSEKPAHHSWRVALLSVTGERTGRWRGLGIAKSK